MNNIFKDNTLEEVAIQLRRSEVKKDKLLKDIYKEYEVYLQIVRNCINSCIEKGVYGLYSELSINHIKINSDIITNTFKKNINLLIDSQLPLLTIEQLKLKDINDHPIQLMNINGLKELLGEKEYEIINFDYENDLIVEDSFQFDFNDNSNTYEYYKYLSEDKLSSINLDNNTNFNSFSKSLTIKKIDEDKQFVISLHELIEETKDNRLKDRANINDKENQFSTQNNKLNCFDLIDKSLTNLLSNLSYNINLELFNINLIKKNISEETFKCIANKNYIIKHPYPFIIRYDLNTNKLLEENKRSSDIYLFNITNIELEFYNLDLSICRNKINELRYKFQLLNKKQGYWKKKEIAINNIKNKI